MTVHDIAALLPDPAELRTYLRALAALDATLGSDTPEYCCYEFTDWGTDEAALWANGSGDEFTVIFTAAGVVIRGFAHESAMSPHRTRGSEVWPGLIDDVPAPLRELLDDPAFTGPAPGPTLTACIWRTPTDATWQTGSNIDFPQGEDPDGSAMLFELVANRSPTSVKSYFEDYYERPVPLTAIEHALAGEPLTSDLNSLLDA